MIGLITNMRGAVVYSVHEAPDHAADPSVRADEMVFLHENFSWLIALFAPFALLARAAWLPLATYFLLTALILTSLDIMAIPQVWSLIAVIAINILFAFETPALQRLELGFKGWQEVAVVSGADEGECYRRFYDAWLTEHSAPQPETATSTASADGTPPNIAGSHSTLRRLFASGP